MRFTKIGKTDRTTFEQTHITWSIPDFSATIQDCRVTRYISPSFSVADPTMVIKLGRNDRTDLLFMCLYIEGKPHRMTDRNFGFKTADGSVKTLKMLKLLYVPLTSDQLGMRFSDIEKRRSELAPRNVVTFVCNLKEEITESTQLPTLDRAESMKFMRLDRLSENFRDAFRNKEFCDTTLRVKDREYKAHRFVLVSRSAVFAAMFKYNMEERQTGVVTITDCDPESFQDFLEYLYSGRLEALTVRSALNLYETSDKYDVPELKAFCVEYLIRCFAVENICEIALLADEYNEVELMSAVEECFNKNVSEISATSEWEHLKENNVHLVNKLTTEMSKVNV